MVNSCKTEARWRSFFTFWKDYSLTVKERKKKWWNLKPFSIKNKRG